jgi:hypothetical protein
MDGDQEVNPRDEGSRHQAIRFDLYGCEGVRPVHVFEIAFAREWHVGCCR